MLNTYQELSDELRKRFKKTCSVVPYSSKHGYEVIIGEYSFDAELINWRQYSELKVHIYSEIHKQIPEVLL